jgi:hypothetical protein
MSVSEDFEPISNIRFDAEVDGLQHEIISFLAITLSLGLLIEISGTLSSIQCQNCVIWIFSILYRGYREMSDIQFCRASQTLSIGI